MGYCLFIFFDNIGKNGPYNKTSMNLRLLVVKIHSYNQPMPVVTIKLYNRPLRVDAEQGQSIERLTSNRSWQLKIKKK
jgi:hypothetical protein